MIPPDSKTDLGLSWQGDMYIYNFPETEFTNQDLNLLHAVFNPDTRNQYILRGFTQSPPQDA